MQILILETVGSWSRVAWERLASIDFLGFIDRIFPGPLLLFVFTLVFNWRTFSQFLLF